MSKARQDPGKPGVLGRIRLASSESEVASALAAGSSFDRASDDTRRKWKRTAESRLVSLKR